ncbi:MAG: PQQ-dependent sugar dehydrogenase [Chloroflexota bacterium]
MSRSRHPRLRAAATLVAGALATLTLAAPAAAWSPAPAAPAPAASVPGVHLVRGGFVQPLFVTNAGDARLFVVEQTGRIRILKQVNGVWKITGTFLDLRGKVDLGHPEQGLLGLAFHPDYATNGRFYVDYTDRRGDTIIAEYRRASAGKADPTSRRVVLKIDQPFDNHNGGWIGFKGPDLYIAMGDGGAGGDPYGNAQNKNVLLGKILRIDPLDPDGSGPKTYAIPAGNPFVGGGGRDEIWAYGLRNPWRDSFDPATGDLWIGDVGQEAYEEIDHAGDGKERNFGWDKVEGRHLYPSGASCAGSCLGTEPVVEIKHHGTSQENCAVVGGYVSRRPGAALEGRYVYGDTCSGRIWSLDADAADPVPGAPLDTSLSISSFGVGVDGAIYLTDLYSGRVYRVKGT